MKNCGSTSPKPVNELVGAIISTSMDSTTSNMLINENSNCQPFSMRGFVSEMRKTNPMACIPFKGIDKNTWEQQRGSMDVPLFKWWRCGSCVREVAPSSVAANESLNELSHTMNSLSRDSTASDMLKNENLNCPTFSIRGYVAQKRNTNPNVCIPFKGISENTWKQLRGSLDVPHFKWWQCRSCVGEPVNSSSTVQDSSLELRVAGGSLENSTTKPPSEAINMVDNINEREIPNIVQLELLAEAEKMAYDHPQLLETSQTSNAEKDSLFEQKTTGFRIDAIVGEGDKDLSVFTDVIDSEDERQNIKTRPFKDLMRVEEKVSVGKGVTTHILQQRTEEGPSSSKGKTIQSKVQGQKLVRPQGSKKTKRSCPSISDTDPTSSKHAKATRKSCRPLL